MYEMPTNRISFHPDTRCVAENEWCRYQEPHKHGFACDRTCPCWNLMP